MRWIAIALLALLLLPVSAALGEPISSMRFRSNMHEIFKNYRGIYISTREENKTATMAHIHLMKDHISNLVPIIPERNADGAMIDKADFNSRLDTLNKTLDMLVDAVTKGDKKMIAELPKTIFTICAGCHTEAKLKYMFRLPSGQKLLGEYMHSVAENHEMARIYFESGDKTEAADHLFIINEYLSLIKKVFPDKGPSGVIMSRDRLKTQITQVERLNELALIDMKQGKQIDFDQFKNSLNSICVSCHEPEKIK